VLVPTIQGNGIDIHYIAAGSGAPVVLLAGFGGDHLSWGLQFPAFRARHHTIAVDNRGCGRSSAPDVPYTSALMAEDVVGVLDHLGIEAAHVVGLSLGGMIAQEVALAHPQRVLTLQLHSTMGRADPYLRILLDTWRQVRAQLGREMVQQSMALWLFGRRTFADRPALIELLMRQATTYPYAPSEVGFARQGEAVVTHDALARLGAISCPTLITAGEDDLLVPPRFGHELAAHIPHAELHRVPDVGHMWCWEKPEEFNALALDFIARHAPAPASR
jgi:pimeloyl-ACP methyl ester carboxylesterase